MLSTIRLGSFNKVIAPSSTAFISIPSFLLPAFHNVPKRAFSASRAKQSHIGRAPVSIPPEVNLTLLPRKSIKGSKVVPERVFIEGPLGNIIMDLKDFVKVEHDTAAKKVVVSVLDTDSKGQREMWGTTRADLQNHVSGVSEGHTAILRLVGVGYRATVEDKATLDHPPTNLYEGQKFVSLKLGYSHPIELPVPKGVTASTPQPTRILLEGVDKRAVMQFAAKIRKWKVPEPYKGKGIFVNDETIKLKAKKIK